jgi:D-galactose 1-dehydrogenase
MLKIALIGLGAVSEHHIRAIGEVAGATLVAGCDQNPNVRGVLPRETAFFDHYIDLLKESLADIYVVATSPATHYEIARDTLCFGHDLLLEKPATATLAELERLKLLYEQAGHKAFAHVALHAAYGLETRWWRYYAQSFRLGDLTAFQASRWDPHIKDGRCRAGTERKIGPWLDSAVNALSIISAFLPEDRLCIVRSRMTGRNLVAGNSEVAGSATVECTYGGKRIFGTIDVDWTLGEDRKFTTLYYGNADASVLLDDSNERIVIEKAGQTLKEIPLANSLPRLTNHYIGVYENLVACHAAGKDNFASAVHLHRLMFKAWEPISLS